VKDRIGRRALLLGRPKTPASFADRFYAKRVPERVPDEVNLREGLPSVETTRVGTPELGDLTGRELPPVPAIRIDGVVRLERARCIAWANAPCTICSERCPTPGAIVLDELARPRVEPSACTGCGDCIQLCPAQVNAFEIVGRQRS
jgi:ferredoxin